MPEFKDYANNWLSVYRCDCTMNQQKQYATMVRFTSAFITKPMENITITDMQTICNKLTPYSSSHVAKYMSLMRSIFKTAQAEGVINRNPMELVKHPKCQKTVGHRALEQWEKDLVTSTYQEHDFGLLAMVMLYAGLRRGEAMYLDVDRDVDFEKKRITVRGAVSFCKGNQPVVTDGKTSAAQRSVPLMPALAKALEGHHGLLCTTENGKLMTQSAFMRKYNSYLTFLEEKVNGCSKRWYGRSKEHQKLQAEGKLPPWRHVKIRCHDFRVDFCTRCYYAGIPLKTLQYWMGHADADMILQVYSKLTKEQEENDSLKLMKYMK